ncbi:hypothetical protein [Halorubrum halodurans]|uniref:hypothetical protein n=1 Tax=Halorubrum halodurans TaxID=1383851 RepID=UPI00117BD8A3|nr:hypothetical protein [Halorubrum halodurans]
MFIDPDDNEVKVSVLTGPRQEARVIPFKTPAKGLWAVPNEGDVVEVYHVNREPNARYPHNSPEFSIPADLGEGDFCIKLNEGTELRFSTQEDGTVDLSVTADGDVSVTAPSVKIGDSNGDFKPVARLGDSISGTGYDGASVSGQIETGSSSVKSS